MAINVASLTASLGLDSSQFQSGLNSASGSLSKFSSSAQGHASSVGGAFEGISARAVALGGIMANVATNAIGALGGAFGALKSGMIDGNAEFERYETQFGVLLKTTDKFKEATAGMTDPLQKQAVAAGLAKDRLAELAKFGAETPFELPEVVRADKILQAFGLHSAESAKKFGMSGTQIRTIAGDVAAGTGAKFEEISNYLGKFSSGATGEAIARMQELGITTRAELAGMGVAFSKSGEMTSPVEVGMSALLQVMQTKFGGMMQAQSSTFEGMMSNLQDWVGQAMRTMGQPIFDALKGQLGSLLTVLNSGQVQAAITGIGSAIGGMVSGGIAALQSLATSVGPVVSALMSAFQGLQSGGLSGAAASIATSLGLGPDAVGQVQAAIQSVQSAVQSGISQVQGILASAGTAWQSFTAAAAGIVSQIGPPLAQVASIVGGILGSAFQTLGGIASSVLAGIPALISAVAGPAQAIASTVGSFLVSAFASLGAIAQAVFAGLPGLAQTVMSVFTAFASFVSSTLAGAFQVILPIAASVFAGIATVVQMALPGLFALANAVGSMLSAAFNALQGVATAVFAAIMPYIPAIQAYIAALAVIVGSVLGAAFNWLAGVIQGTVIPAIQSAGAWLAQNLPGAIQVVMNFITGTLLPGLLNLATWLAQNLPGAIQALSGFWTGVLQPAIATVWGFISGALFPLFLQLVGWLQTNIPQALAALSNFWQQHGDQILSIAQTAWDTIRGVIDSVLGTITGLWQAFQSAREGDWQGFGEKLRAIWDASWEAIKNALAAAGPAILGILSDLVNNAVAVFQSINWGEVGSNIVRGVADGIRNGAGMIADAARNAARAALDAAKGFLGISSPSKVMAEEVGLPMAQGLAAGFASGLDGAALVGIVASIVKVMEQIAQVLKGVGDKISTSDWEDLAGPVKLMADTFKAIADIGATLAQENMAANWATARQQAAAMIASARQIMIDLASVVKGVGDQVSTSDWEDFTAPLKLLADSLASIGSISSLFADQKSQPSLAGLGGVIRQLAVDARALLVDLDSAIQPIASGLPDKLKTLGDAAAGARSVADGALGLVLSLQEALKVDWAAINFSAAGVMMHDLAGMVVYFAGKAQEASLAIAKIDTTGLAPLKAAAENLIGIADGARALVERLVDALTVNWGAVKWADAGRMMTDLAGMVRWFAEKAQTASIAIGKIDTTGLAPLKAAAENLVGIIDGARAIITRLQDALAFDWGSVNFAAAGQAMGRLAQVAVDFALTAATAAASLAGINTGGMDVLKSTLSGLLDTFTALTDLIEFVLGDAIPTALGRVQAAINQVQATLASVGVQMTVTPADLFRAILDPILALGVALTQVIAQGTAALAGVDTSGYDKLASVMGNAQETIKKIIDLSDFILDLFTNGGLFDAATRIQAILAELNSRLAGMGQGPTDIQELLRQMLAPILALGVALAEVAAEATASLANLETGGLSKLNDAIGGLQTALESIPKAIRQILTDWQQGWPDINPEQAAALVITPLLNLGMALARAAATAAASLSTLQTDGLSRLNDAVGGLQTALETIPKLLRQILTTWQQGWPDLDPEQAAQLVIGPLFRLGIALAQAAETAAAGMASVTTDAVKALGDAVGLVLSALKNTLDLFKLLTTALAGGPLDMTGAGLHPEFVDALVTYAVGVAESFLAAAGAFDGVVTDASKALGDALNAALGTAKNALEILALFSKTLAGGPVDMTTADLHPELIDALATYAVDLATAFLAVANAFRGEVTDGAKQLGDALNAAMGTTKNALEILALFTKTLASGPLDMMTAGLHPELIDALTTYAVGLATAFLAVANTFDGVVTDGAKALGDALNAAMSTAKNALELLALFGKTLTGGPLDMTTAGLHPELIDALTAYAISLAESFLAAANSFDGVVSDGAKQLGDALNAALSTVKNALEALTLFNDTLKNGPLDMTGAGIHPELVDALTTYAVGIAAAFLDVANTFRGEVTDGAKALGEAMGGALGVIKDVLEFNDLRAAIVSFKPLDMAVYGPKLDLIFAAVKEVAQRFVEKAKTANISQAMQEAADALAKVFGDAAGSIKGALDMAASLLDPQTQIPSIGQIQGKLDAVLNLVEAVTRQFAARAAAIGPDTAKSAEGLSNAVKSVFDAISQVITAVQDAADLYLGTAGFNNIAALMSYLFGIFDQFAGQSESVNAVTAAITSLLGGIQALVSSAGFTAGQTWGQQFAAGLAAVAGGVTAAAGGAIAATGAGATGQAGARALPPGTLTGTTNIYNAPQTMTVNVGLSTAAGLPDTLTLLTNMARG